MSASQATILTDYYTTFLIIVSQYYSQHFQSLACSLHKHSRIFCLILGFFLVLLWAGGGGFFVFKFEFETPKTGKIVHFWGRRLEKEMAVVVVIFPIYSAEMILHESWGAAELLVLELLILLNCSIMTEHEILQLQLHSSISPPLEICIISKERRRWLDMA